jgi:glycine/D-amino acid oxidase-like deaminating enzyme
MRSIPPPSLPRFCAALAAGVVAALLGSGCGPVHAPVYPVKGQVLLDGKPAPQATVTFHPLGGDKERTPSGQTDDQGNFTLTSFSSGDGAPEGEYAVTVTCFRTAATRNPTEGDYTARNVVAPRYANPDSSQLKATVTRGSNELPPFQVRAR